MVLGIVVTDENHYAEHETHLVLKLNRRFRSPRDFNLVALEKRERMPILATQEDVEAQRKFQEKAIYFGTVVKWDEYNTGNMVSVIFPSKYNIMSDCMYPTRVHLNQTQILLNGIMSRNREVFWTDTFPSLKIPYSLRKKATPDVAVTAWVTLQILPNYLLKYELSEFESVAIEFQHSVRSTPWFVASEDRNTRARNVDEKENVFSYFEKPPSLELCGIDGVVISSSSVISIKYPNVAFRKIVADKNPLPPVGTRVKMNAHWLEFVGYYAITSTKIDANAKTIGTTDDGFLRVTIKKSHLPGLFINENLGIYIDDPENILEIWHFSKYSNSSLSVAICDGSPDRNGQARYFIVEITDKKGDKLGDTLKNGEMKMEQCVGLVVERRSVFVCNYPYFKIRLSIAQADQCPIGSVVRICASYDGTWIVTNAEIDEKVPRFECRTNLKVEDKKRTFYRIPSVTGVKQLPRCLSHPIFGLIATPPSFVELKNANIFNYEDIWVTSNDSHPGDIMLPPYRFQYMTSGEIDIGENIENSSLPEIDTSDVESIASSDVTTLSRHRRRVRFAENEREIRLIESTRSECFANNLNVPETSITFERGLHVKNWTALIEESYENIVQSKEFKENPQQKIKIEIDRHTENCSTCLTHTFNEMCYFPDLLAQFLLNYPPLTNVVTEKDMLSSIVFRKFKT